MTQWRIDPVPARAIADTVATAGETLANHDEGDGAAFSETAMTDLGTNLDQGDYLPQAKVAVSQLLEAEGTNVTNIMNAISAATIGLRTVVAMYEYAGNEMGSQMAASQTAAVDAAETGDFSYFITEE
ncbi:hypothetical protein [Pseudactinotalea sp.]|uniref:hypothetical protein n=1 Tax=Pseudactinotalea sp. TaxID=1926260 RepID=UPI003B3B8770